MNKPKIGTFAVRAVSCVAVLFAACMIAAGVALMFPSCTGKFAYGYVMRQPFLGAMLYGFSLFGIWAFFECFSRRHPSYSARAEMYSLALLCLAAYVAFIEILPAIGQVPEAMTYDPAQVLRSMKSGKIRCFHNASSQNWCNYEILMSMLAVVFKGGQRLGELFQAVCCAVALLPLFRLSERIAGRRAARFTVLMMGFSPTIVMYSTVLTGEILSALLMSLAAYCLLDALDAKRGWLDVVLMMFVSGLLLAFSELFKSTSLVFIAATAVLLAIGALRCWSRAFILRLVVAALVFYPAYRCALRVGQTVLSELSAAPPAAAPGGLSSAMLYELALGLNVENEGFYSGKFARKINAMPVDRRSEALKEAIQRDWKKYPMLMVRKFRNIHGSSVYHHGAVSTFQIAFRDKRGRREPRWVWPLADSGTMFFKVLFLLGCIGLFLSAARSFSAVAPGVLSASIVLGFAVVEQLIEGLGRYKVSVYPFYFLVVPYAFATVDSVWSSIVRVFVRFRPRRPSIRENLANESECE